MHVRLFAAAAACSVLGACGAGQGLGILGGANLSPDPIRYVQQAAASDLFEMRAGQLVLEKSQRADVRALARELVEAHSRSTQQLAAAALAVGMSAPAPALTASQEQMLAALQAAGPDSVDALYLRQQAAVHQAAKRLHETYALSGDAEPLRFAASSASAAVAGHFQEVRRIRREAGFD